MVFQSPTDGRLTRKEIDRLVNDWIGVNGGYLGDFSYRTHDRFWMDMCEREVNTSAFPGTTRMCFENTLFEASALEQAAALRAILDEYSLPSDVDPARRRFRTPALRDQIIGWASRLELGEIPVSVELESASEIVKRALDDADTLMRSSGPQSAVDRVHTAMHGYLHRLCDEARITVASERPTMTQLFKSLRTNSPILADLGVRSEEVSRIVGSLATILDALNPVRNNASVAHPNDTLIGEPEARLVINTVRSLLSYFESKRRQQSTTAQQL